MDDKILKESDWYVNECTASQFNEQCVNKIEEELKTSGHLEFDDYCIVFNELFENMEHPTTKHSHAVLQLILWIVAILSAGAIIGIGGKTLADNYRRTGQFYFIRKDKSGAEFVIIPKSLQDMESITIPDLEYRLEYLLELEIETLTDGEIQEIQDILHLLLFINKENADIYLDLSDSFRSKLNP